MATKKPRHEGVPAGGDLAFRIEALLKSPNYSPYGPEMLAAHLGVSLSTLYRWKAGEATRISRAVARNLEKIEQDVKASSTALGGA